MSSLESKVISFLRFPLCVGVVLIHVNVIPNAGSTPIYDSIHLIFREVIARVAVPLFFMFSGYFFFYKSVDFCFLDYKMKLRKRIRTLLIPYLFWNLTLIMYYLLGRGLGLGSQYGVGFDFVDWLKPFWNDYSTPNGSAIASFPISYQLWYLRDLMVTVLLSPIIYLLIKKFRIYFIVSLATLYITNYFPLITGLNITALFFFSLGGYCSLYEKNFAEILKPYTLLLGFGFLILSVPIIINQSVSWGILRRIGLLFGMAFTVSLSARYLASNNNNVNSFLSDSSFFIFAYHVVALVVISDVVDFSYNTDFLCTIMYFVYSGGLVVLGLILYYLLKRYFPKFTTLITGGR